MAMSTLANREGFALPMAILVIGVMTAGVVASFTRVGAEVLTVDNQRGQTAAFALAEEALATFLVNGRVPSTVDTAVATYTLPGGTATVLARRVHRTGNRSLVLVRATGSATSPAGRPPATRTVAQFAIQEPIQMQVLSAWTSLSGMHKNGNSGWFAGEDASGILCGDGATRAGIAVPNNLATGQHIHNRASGSPAVDYLGTKQQAADGIDIDWAGLIDPAGPAIAPAAIRCAQGEPGYNSSLGPCEPWPSSFASYPTIIINGSMTLPSSGKGLLIVTGNLTLNGNQNWDGIILVGGRVRDNGQGHITGAVVSGLNMKLGQTVEESEVEIALANGQKRYEFDSCSVQNALAGASSGLKPYRNAWVDNWATW